MRKKNGFTLVELLAVIVLLAIIIAITIPIITGNMKKSKQQAFEVAGETISDYLVKHRERKLLKMDFLSE